MFCTRCDLPTNSEREYCRACGADNDGPEDPTLRTYFYVPIPPVHFSVEDPILFSDVTRALLDSIARSDQARGIRNPWLMHHITASASCNPQRVRILFDCHFIGLAARPFFVLRFAQRFALWGLFGKVNTERGRRAERRRC